MQIKHYPWYDKGSMDAVKSKNANKQASKKACDTLMRGIYKSCKEKGVVVDART